MGREKRLGHSEKFLYSVNTLLAYEINEEFYGGTHYVWCAPRYDEPKNPPSSNPKEICASLLRDIAGNDLHSGRISQNRAGLLLGVQKKYEAGKIDDDKRNELTYIINNADLSFFRPIIYVIDKSVIETGLRAVHAREKANYFSKEWRIEELKSAQFDIIAL